MSRVSGGIGDVRWSVLDEPLFQQQNGTQWALADGRSIAGTNLAALTGWTTLPDMRGNFPRNIGGGDNATIALVSVNTGTEEITITAPSDSSYALATAQKCSFTGTPPSPLVSGTTYYVIKSTAIILKVATTYANAVAGVAVNLTAYTGPSNIVLQRAHGSAQTDQLQGHAHTSNEAANKTGGFNAPGIIASVWYAGTSQSNTSTPITDGSNGTPRTGGETRPKNIGLYCYVRVT